MTREIGMASHTRIVVLPVGARPLRASLEVVHELVETAGAGVRYLVEAMRPALSEEFDWLGVQSVLQRPRDGTSGQRQLIPLFLLRQDEEEEEEEAEESYIEIVPVDPGDREGAAYLLDEETSIGFMAVNENAEELIGAAAGFTSDEAVAEDFAERQRLAQSGRQELIDKLDEEFPESPDISGGDIDAAWDSAMVGAETVGGTAPTPDQDVVDLLGVAAGLTYEHDVPLNTGERLAARDRDSWELNPESAGAEQLVEEEE